ncbi:MAG TPA: hypothetical protein VEP90_10900, partial [Methylomirabilota bacterium]|nr:hypothetical protein [Methylomirabilota bacterium]
LSRTEEQRRAYLLGSRRSRVVVGSKVCIWLCYHKDINAVCHIYHTMGGRRMRIKGHRQSKHNRYNKMKLERSLRG